MPVRPHRIFNIQRQQTLTRKSIEKKIRKLRAGKVPWLLKLQDLKNKLTLWKLVFKKKKKGKVSSKRILELRRLTGNWTANIKSLATIDTSLQNAYNKYNTVKKNNTEDLRDNFLDNHAIELAKRMEQQ